MPENHAQMENIPIALRLIPIMAGWWSKELKEVTTEEMCGRILLSVYNWNQKEPRTPVPLNRLLLFLKDCNKEASIKEFIKTIPSNYFVFSADFDIAHHNYYTFTNTEPPGLYSLSPDWSPFIQPYQALLNDCPNEMMKPIQEISQSLSKRKSKTEIRKSILQKRAVSVYKNLPPSKQNKTEVCEILLERWNAELPKNVKRLKLGTIESDINNFKEIKAKAKKN